MNSAPPGGGSSHAPSRGALFAFLGALLSLVATLAILELALRFFYPQETLRPRWAFSPQYCSTVYPSVRMIHERPGRWRFVYSINEYQYRGPAVPVAAGYARPNVVVLGDSYSFGAGVNDGEEYAAVLDRALAGAGRVVNLGVGGWGLTQEIRRYYDFGIRYAPRVVILQFSANDPQDNLKCPVTEIRDGRFLFHDSHEGIFRIKELISRSVIQKSQIYNLVRDRLYRLMEARVVAKTRASLVPHPDEGSTPIEEDHYVRLLEHFIRDLNARGASVIFLSVNDQLKAFPFIAGAVDRLQKEGFLRARDAADWLSGAKGYSSPEGHLWGTEAHRIIGGRLAEIVRAELATWSPSSDKP